MESRARESEGKEGGADREGDERGRGRQPKQSTHWDIIATIA